MSTSNLSRNARPPSPPRLRSTDLPEDSDTQAAIPEPFLSGHPILLEDMDMSDLPHGQLYEMTQKFLEESMESDCPLVSPPESLSMLRSEYDNSPKYQAQIDWLIDQGYRTLIRTKGDGNCFYRALAFAYLDRVIKSPTSNRGHLLNATKDILARAGFDYDVYSDAYEILESLVQPSLGHSSLGDLFRDQMTSNYIVMYMRLLTSAQMRVDDSFIDFISDPESEVTSIDEFCKQSVEPMAKEADHIQVAALAQALGVHLEVAYLDGHSESGRVDFHNFQNNTSNDAQPLFLLYRPGHYDILQ